MTPPAPSPDPLGDDPDDPMALPLPPDSLLLEDAGPIGCAADRPRLVMQVLRQQMAELGLNLSLQEAAAAPADRGWSGGDGLVFLLQGFRVQLVCAPFWADELLLPAAPWRQPGQSPQLLLGAWVEEESGVVRLPGVLTAAELLNRCAGFPHGQAPRTLPLTAFLGGLERLFQLVRLLSPEALTPLLTPALPSLQTPLPTLRSAAAALVVMRDWLEGQLGEALAALGAELLPATAGAFRSAAVQPRSAALATVSIPLGLVLGRIQCGPGRSGASERFQLILQLCGEGDGTEWLQVWLEPDLPGDLLPQRLALSVGDQVIDTGLDGSSEPLSLTVPAGNDGIGISLRHGGGSQIELPFLYFFRADHAQGEADHAQGESGHV